MRFSYGIEARETFISCFNGLLPAVLKYRFRGRGRLGFDQLQEIVYGNHRLTCSVDSKTIIKCSHLFRVKILIHYSNENIPFKKGDGIVLEGSSNLSVKGIHLIHSFF